MKSNNNNQQDEFSQVFREKLANHTLPVDSTAWDAIQAKLTKPVSGATLLHSSSSSTSPVSYPAHASLKAKRRFGGWNPISAAASLALLISIGWYFMSRDAVDQQVIAENFIPESSSVVTSSEAEPLNSIQSQSSVQSSNSEQSPISVRSEIKTSIDNHYTPTSSSQKESEIVATIAEKEGESSELEAIVTKPTEPQIAKTKPVVPEATGDWTELLPGKKKQKPLLAAGLGSVVTGGSLSPGSPQYDVMYESFLESAVDAPKRVAALSPVDFENKEYLPPLTAGLKVRLPFSETWSFETGLQYTFLQTKLTDAAWSGYSANLQMHYLGMPVGIAAVISKTSKWELYWSGGVVAEKGLYSLYREYRDWGNAVFTTTASSGIDGWQWSVYTTLGVGYRIERNLTLYFDPQLSYFFDNDQPLSIRTEMPLSLGLSAGLRFSF